MDYWFLSVSLTNLISYGLLSLAWAAGGWLLSAHIFKLRPTERLLCGISAGWNPLYNALESLRASDAIGWSILGSCIIDFIRRGMGCLALGPAGEVPFERPARLASTRLLAGLTVLFELIQRGLALSDEYMHLPIVSALAAVIFHSTSRSTRPRSLPIIIPCSFGLPPWCGWRILPPGLPGISPGPSPWR